ncbi:MAG: flagellar export protein FliJ [Gammaproteobacteria bacterium]|nr:flagellar export protein FliJ [Gammaproteobacteria bacterium]
MTRSQKLNAALEVLDFKLNKQFSSLVELMQHKIENDKKLQDLMAYQNGYMSKSTKKENQTIANIQIHHTLMGKLQLAIDTQQQVVQGLEYEVNQRIQSLQKDQAQNRALGVLVKRYRKQEFEINERNEQKELDSQILAMLQSDISPGG